MVVRDHSGEVRFVRGLGLDIVLPVLEFNFGQQRRLRDGYIVLLDSAWTSQADVCQSVLPRQSYSFLDVGRSSGTCQRGSNPTMLPS